MTLRLERVGYLVPAGDFDATVHSVFVRACNFAHDDSLITLVAHGLADGPTTLRLARGDVPDLRLILRPGDRLRSREGVASLPGVRLRLRGVAIWRPVSPRVAVSTRQLGANLQFAESELARFRRTHSSVIDREAGPTLAALFDACRNFDTGQAALHLERLIGWGEGLTPAGDDALVGLRAALDAMAGDQTERMTFLRVFSAAIVMRTSRTTPIAAHCLRLAAQGHFNADVMDLRNALLGARGPAGVEAALHRALDAGATSGADMVTGLLGGLAAWHHIRADAEPERAPE